MPELNGSVGHGTIRMRGYSEAAAPPPLAPVTSAASVGHGTIRLRGRDAPVPAAATAPAPPSPTGPVGHGTIRLRG